MDYYRVKKYRHVAIRLLRVHIEQLLVGYKMKPIIDEKYPYCTIGIILSA